MHLRWSASYDPWREFRALQRHMDDVFRGLFPDQERLAMSHPYRGGAAFNVVDRGDAYVLEAALPGLDSKDIDIQGTHNSLTIKGERKLNGPEGYAVHRRERGDLRFARTFTFDSKLDLERVSASMKNGVLKVEVTKQPNEQPRKIAIKA